MMKLFPVATEKTLLRPFRLDDVAAKARLDSDPDIRKHLGRPSRLEDDISAFELRGYGLVAIVDCATGCIVGYAKLQSPEWEERFGLELVVAVAAEARRKGFGLDAAQMLIRIGYPRGEGGRKLRRPSIPRTKQNSSRLWECDVANAS